MRLKGALLAAVATAAVTGGLYASTVSAAPHANGIVPLFCSNDTIPAGVQLQLRMRWVVKNSGQITKFLSTQKLVWTVYDSSNNILASHTPNPEYGDKTLWSAPVHSNTTDLTGDGVIDDVWYADYLAPTGVTLTAGQQVRVAYTLTANSKTDDGFRGFPGEGPWPAFSVITSGTSCNVTGT